MNITATNVQFAARMPKPKVKKIEKIELPDFFRDNELFDPKKDKVTDEYFQYDVEDIAAGIRRELESFDMNQVEKQRTFRNLPAYNDVVELYRNSTVTPNDSITNIFEKIQ